MKKTFLKAKLNGISGIDDLFLIGNISNLNFKTKLKIYGLNFLSEENQEKFKIAEYFYDKTDFVDFKIKLSKTELFKDFTAEHSQFYNGKFRFILLYIETGSIFKTY